MDCDFFFHLIYLRDTEFWQASSSWVHHYCQPGSTLAGNWNQELEPKDRAQRCLWYVAILAAGLSTHFLEWETWILAPRMPPFSWHLAVNAWGNGQSLWDCQKLVILEVTVKLDSTLYSQTSLWFFPTRHWRTDLCNVLLFQVLTLVFLFNPSRKGTRGKKKKPEENPLWWTYQGTRQGPFVPFNTIPIEKS